MGEIRLLALRRAMETVTRRETLLGTTGLSTIHPDSNLAYLRQGLPRKPGETGYAHHQGFEQCQHATAQRKTKNAEAQHRFDWERHAWT